jgi:hypothetical protein
MDAVKYLRGLQVEAQKRLNEARARQAGPGEQIPILQDINSYDAAIAALVEAEIRERENKGPFTATGQYRGGR